MFVKVSGYGYATVWIATSVDVNTRLRDVLAATVLESQDPEPTGSFPSGPLKVASLHAARLNTDTSVLMVHPPQCSLR